MAPRRKYFDDAAPPDAPRSGVAIRTSVPMGAATSIQDAIRATLGQNAEQVVAFLADVLTGAADAGIKDRMEAAKILLDRGWGKPAEMTVTLDATAAAANRLPADVLEKLAGEMHPALPAPEPPSEQEDPSVMTVEEDSYVLCKTCGEPHLESALHECP